MSEDIGAKLEIVTVLEEVQSVNVEKAGYVIFTGCQLVYRWSHYTAAIVEFMVC